MVLYRLCKFLYTTRIRRALAIIMCFSCVSFVCIQLKHLSTEDNRDYTVDPICKNCLNKNDLNSKAEIFKTGGLTQLNTHDYDERQLIKDLMGKVNFDMWKDTCLLSFNSLRQHPFFPSQPHVRSYLQIQDSLKINGDGSSYGMRVMGYLHPPVTGNYTFHLESYFLSQFWLSRTSNPQNTTKIAHTTLNKIGKFIFFVGSPKNISNKIFLEYGKKYYFEILKVLNAIVPQQNRLWTDLKWNLPGTGYFSKIEGKYVSNYFNVTNDTSLYYDGSSEKYGDNLSASLEFSDEEDENIAERFPLNTSKSNNQKIIKQRFNRTNVRGLPYLERNNFLMALPNCKYKPSYMKRKIYKRYEGIWNVWFPKIYPDDGTGRVRWDDRADKDGFVGSELISKNETEAVVSSFITAINKMNHGHFSLVDIVNVEKVTDKKKGDRFLLELVVKRIIPHRQKLFRVSKFVFRKLNQTKLCVLKSLSWNPKVWINVILNVKNQAGWVLYFIKDIARLIKETHDKYIRIVIADYGNDGLDIAEELKRHGIKNYKVINHPGMFHKTASINRAVSTIKDPNSIVLLMDLHLQLPLDFFDRVRKHIFKGILAFTPILLRLDLCGRPRTPHLAPSGCWEPLGFGIFGIYKSDWDRFGGMNVKEFKNKWGGEDWEMVDRVLAKGIEIDKQRVPGFYHFHHDKKGMWNT